MDAPRLGARWALLAIGIACAATACGGDDGLNPGRGPVIHASTVAPNPNNVISAVVTVQAEGSDSVAVRFGLAGSSLGNVTPAVVPSGGWAVVPVLGLLPDQDHELRVIAWGGGRNSVGSVEGAVLPFTTGILPDDLPEYVASGSDPSPGYVVFAVGTYGVAIDNSGRVVWYHRFPMGPGPNFQPQPNGRYAARPPPADPFDPMPWIEIDPLGNETRTLGCAGGLRSRFHDLRAERDGSYWILCDETRTMDLSRLGGHADARVTATVVQHVGKDGGVRFAWSVFDHFEIADLDPSARSGPAVNWTHGNALDLDPDGHVLVSFRNLDEITRIDPRTGEVVWRMGGVRSDFELLDPGTPAFARQHGLRMTAQGEFLLLDNSGDPAGSAARRYTYDATARTLRAIRSYASPPPVLAEFGGTTQALPGGRALVSFGSAGRVEEYDAAGRVVWRIEDPGYVFAARRIASLYDPAVSGPPSPGR